MPPVDDVEVEESDAASENGYETSDKQDEDTMPEASLKLEPGANSGEGPDVKKPKLDPKDPLRPRRKKARRACFACQRAHLTCGDERPCQRCIKRGLGDQCQDGVRKKAKYLHDAPPEALRPVLGPNYNPGSNGRTISHASNSSVTENSPNLAGFFPQDSNQSPNFMQYQQMRHQQQMPPPMQEPMPFLSQQSPISPQFAANQQIQASMHQMPNAMVAPDMKMQDPSQNPYAGGALFDPSNPALFNFDLDSLNFGNHYGAMEFSMLNHMSSGAAETPPHDQSIGGHGGFDAGNVYGNVSHFQGGGMYGGDGMLGEYGLQRQDSSGSIYQLNNAHLPRAYAIESGPISNPSPSTDAHASPQSFVIDASPKSQFSNTSIARQQQQQQQQQQAQAQHSRNHSSSIKPSPSKFAALAGVAKPRKDTSSAYAVTEPYSYTTGFHALTDFVRTRFTPSTTLKIAKSLASIRPSFISCTQSLDRQDLVFMEQCFQRTLLQLEEFMETVSTPTLVCRRSGEVAAVNKEFSMMTGWRKDVLLGKAPNLNINTGKSASERTSREGSLTSTGRAGLTTPRTRGLEKVEGRPTYVLLAELLDDDGVIEFYEDFARLAFGDSRGSVSRRCKLLKYKAKELNEDNSSAEEREREREHRERKKKEELRRMREGGGAAPKINGEFGIGRLEKDGKLDCAYCWTVKRDVFDIPMMIVMNFLPCV